MKLLIFFIILIFLQNCSFDNKTGIWKNKDTNYSKKDKNLFEEFETVTSIDQLFNQTIIADNKLKLIIRNPITNFEWKDTFYSKTNNLKNFSLKGLNQVTFKSKMLLLEVTYIF